MFTSDPDRSSTEVLLPGALSRSLLTFVSALLFSLVVAPGVAAQAKHVVATFHESGHGFGSFPNPVPGGQSEGFLLFEAAQEPGGYSGCLWRTDGTAEGTFPLRDHCLFIASPRFTGPLGSLLVFPSTDAGPIDLWASDGTVEGTRPLTAGALTSQIVGLAHAVNPDRLVFVASDATHGQEPWISDGSPEGTHLLADLVPGPEGSSPTGLAILDDGTLTFYAARQEPPWWLWTSDLTAAGTSVGVVLSPSPETYLSRLYPAGKGALLWLSQFVGGSDCRYDLWRSDGTMPGTFFLKTFEVPGCEALPLIPNRLGDELYFQADDGLHGPEIWRSDGLSLERLTDTVSDQLVDNLGARPVPLGEGVGMVLDGGNGLGTELWLLGGGTPASAPLLDLCPGSCSGVRYLYPVSGGRVAFAGNDGEHGFEPWISDGTVAGTRLLADLCPGPCSSSPNVAGTFSGYVLLFADDGSHGEELWRLDVPDGLVRRLTDFEPANALQWGAAPFGDLLFFGADDGPHGAEPWISDGTRPGTRLLTDLIPDEAAPPPGPEPTQPPAAPEGLEVTSFSDSSITLRWQDLSDDETDFVLEARTPSEADWFLIATSPADQPGVNVYGLPPSSPYALRVRARNAAGLSAPSNTAAATTRDVAAPAPCQSSDDLLCLGAGRFRVAVQWRNQHAAAGEATHGVGHALAATGSDRSGYFWFFRPDNVELVVKVLDGRAVNGHFWTFFGALSDVEYWISVTDTAKGTLRTYYNAPGEICGEGDTRSLPANQVAAQADEARLLGERHLPGREIAQSFAGSVAFSAAADRVASPSHPFEPCVEDAETLCLLDGRFRIRVTWEDQHNGGSGVGGAVPFADRSGFFWFFNPANVELVVKVLDGTPVNGKIWVFYGALSDVGYTIEVLDTFDGHLSGQYVNPPGNICGDADTQAF